MKRWFYIVLVLVAVVGCNTPPPCGHPLSEGDGPTHEVCQKLEEIDSLMWRQPDSALAVMMEFAGSEAADSLDEFDGHYCQLLISELLYKNDYGQSNRKEVVKALGYFDSIDEGFLAARAHYMNGVGFYERDSVVAACGEYLKALEIVETHFPGIETQNVAALQVEHLPRFMALTYGRLGELFSEQFMTGPAIFCYKKSFVFNRIEPTSVTGMARVLISIGQQYNILKQNDTAGYYYDEAFKNLPDTNNLAYRDLISGLAVYNFYLGRGVEPTVCDLKRMAAQTADEDEKLTRYFTIGSIYFETSQFDSALVYLAQVFENKDNVGFKREAARNLHDIYQIRGDSLKATEYAIYQAENPLLEEESNWLVSQLNELFQQHLQWEQEKALAEERQVAKQRQTRIVVAIVVLLLTLGLGLWWWMAKRRKEHETETQTLNEEKQQLQTRVDDALQQLQTVDDALQQLQTQADDAQQQARAMLLQRVNDFYRSKLPNRLERILAEFEAAYPQAMEKLAAAYPELSETEQQISVLNYLHFRAKEEADLLGLSDNTVNKYRSNLRKKTGNASFSSFLD